MRTGTHRDPSDVAPHVEVRRCGWDKAGLSDVASITYPAGDAEQGIHPSVPCSLFCQMGVWPGDGELSDARGVI